MLQLANLRSTSDNANQRVNLDLSETLAWCMAQAQPMAQQHEVVIEGDLEPARTLAVEDHMKMLFANLLANALLYSQRGGRVCARCTCSSGTPTVTIEDEGIGIPAEKLPRIFDEYYRTNEAVRHNKESSGLGLAIVRHVVQTNEIGVRVESKPGVGTRFVLRFAPAVGAPDAGKEMEDGVCDGS
jgi:signal transduction histidine kinase